MFKERDDIFMKYTNFLTEKTIFDMDKENLLPKLLNQNKFEIFYESKDTLHLPPTNDLKSFMLNPPNADHHFEKYPTDVKNKVIKELNQLFEKKRKDCQKFTFTIATYFSKNIK